MYRTLVHELLILPNCDLYHGSIQVNTAFADCKSSAGCLEKVFHISYQIILYNGDTGVEHETFCMPSKYFTMETWRLPFKLAQDRKTFCAVSLSPKWPHKSRKCHRGSAKLFFPSCSISQSPNYQLYIFLKYSLGLYMQNSQDPATQYIISMSPLYLPYILRTRQVSIVLHWYCDHRIWEDGSWVYFFIVFQTEWVPSSQFLSHKRTLHYSPWVCILNVHKYKFN